MIEALIPIIICTSMFAMIFGIVYVKSRENMAMIEKGLNPKKKDIGPRPFINLKWGLLLTGLGMGLLLAYIIDNTLIKHDKYEQAPAFTFGGHHSFHKNRPVANVDTAHKATDTSASVNVTINESAEELNGRDEDAHSVVEYRGRRSHSSPLYFALIAIGGGLGLFFSYRIEKKEWLDKRTEA